MATISAPYAQAGYASYDDYQKAQQMDQLALMQQQEALKAARLSSQMLEQQMAGPQAPDPLSATDYRIAQQTLYGQIRDAGQIAPQFRASSDNLTPEQLQAERAAHWQQVNADIAAGKYQYKTANEAHEAVNDYMRNFSEGGIRTNQALGTAGLSIYGAGSTPTYQGFQNYLNQAGATGMNVLGTGGTTGTGAVPTTGGAYTTPTTSPTGGTTGGGIIPSVLPPAYSGGQVGGSPGIPAPGTLVPTSFNIGGMYGSGYGADQAAIDETKAIYGDAISQQNALTAMYGNQTQAAQQQMQGTADAYADREATLSQYLEGLGDSERAQIEARRVQMMEAAKQDLARRGLTSTTAYDAAMRGVENVAGEQMAAFQDAMQRKRMDYMSVLSGEKLAAQSGAADFAANQAAQRFAAAQTPVQSMTELAQLLAQQRDSAANRAAQLQMSFKDIGLEYAKMQHDAQQSAADRMVSQFQIGQQTGLGYAGIAADQQAARLGYNADIQTAKIAKAPVRYSGGPASGMAGKI